MVPLPTRVLAPVVASKSSPMLPAFPCRLFPTKAFPHASFANTPPVPALVTTFERRVLFSINKAGKLGLPENCIPYKVAPFTRFPVMTLIESPWGPSELAHGPATVLSASTTFLALNTRIAARKSKPTNGVVVTIVLRSTRAPSIPSASACR